MRTKGFFYLFIYLFMFNVFSTHAQYNFIDWPYVKTDDLNKITFDFLSKEVAPRLNITYLGPTKTPSQTKKFTGIILPPHNFISLPVQLEDTSCEKNVIDVIFKVNTGVSSTTLAPRTFSQLYKLCRVDKWMLHDDLVKINGKNQYAYPLYSFKDLYFAEVNLLGTKFLEENNVKLVMRDGTFTMEFLEDEKETNDDEIKMLGGSEQF